MSHCDLAFVCDKRLHDLAPTDRMDARHCNDCNKHVFMVSTDEEITMAKVLRRCVAITLGALDVGGPLEYRAPAAPELLILGADEEAEQMLASSWYRAKLRSLLDPDE